MFQSARLKLTAWYLLIIMLISSVFSVVIYKGITLELERGIRRSELRFRARELGVKLPQPIPPRWEKLRPELQDLKPREVLLADLQETKQRVRLYLLLINGGILVFSATAGYFLARKTLKPIERAMEEQKRFVADASHEFRTPLAALKTSIEVALKDEKMTTQEARKVLASNLEEVDSLQSLSNDLLSLSSHQKDDNNFSFKKVNFKKVVESSCKKIKPLAKKKNIELTVSLGTKGQALQGDEKSLEKTILIFLDNAVKYTLEKGEVTISTKTDKKHLFVEIKDTGIGISKEDIPHIFDRFYRVDQSRSKENVLGYGLGLSLAKRIIEMHKGSVEVESSLGKGTTFTIKLPLRYS